MAQVKLLKIANNVPTEHDGTADDLTVLSATTDTINERTGAAGVTIDGVLLKDSGATFGANVVMSDFSLTGVDTITFTDVNGTIAGIENQNLLDKTAAETVSGAYTFSTDVNIKETTNDGNPELRIGATDAEELHIQTVYDSGAQTLDYVLFQTDVASATADKGLFRFNVDGSNIMDVDDGGIVVTGDVSATSHGGITEANLVDKSATEVITGAWDFGGAADLEIPNGAAPTVDTAGQIAIDTTITDHTGLITYHDGTEALYVIALPTGNLDNTDGDVVSYNATNNEFEMVPQGGTDYSQETYTNGNAASIALGDVVYLEAGVNDTVELADADTISHGETIVGIATATIGASASGAIHTQRGRALAGVLTAATAGDVYYLSTTGTSTNTLTTTAPSGGPAIVKIGFAKNATDLVFDPMFIADTTA
jgi:hypothetical protein